MPTDSQATKRVGGVTYGLWYYYCPTRMTPTWIPDLPPRDLGRAAADRVARMLPPPLPRSAPAADKGIVNLGMWFWVDRAMWRPVSATAWVPTPTGVLWATATATPVRLTFEPGDGVLGSGTVTCAGPGAVWTPADGDDTPSDCMYTYTHASAMDRDGAFAGHLSVDWSIAWRSSTGAGGGLPGYTSTAAVDLTVRDIQAIVVDS